MANPSPSIILIFRHIVFHKCPGLVLDLFPKFHPTDFSDRAPNWSRQLQRLSQVPHLRFEKKWCSIVLFVWGFPARHGDPHCWMVFVRENPKQEWMIVWGTPMTMSLMISEKNNSIDGVSMIFHTTMLDETGRSPIYHQGIRFHYGDGSSWEDQRLKQEASELQRPSKIAWFWQAKWW